MRKFVKEAIDLITRRHVAWNRVFEGPDGRQVERQLSIFCFANTTTFDIDPIKSAYKQGRKDVWILMQNYRHLTPKQLAVIYQAATFEDKNDE
jgi:hypothetical protein